MKTKNKGFTFVQLVIVLVLLAIIAFIAAPQVILANKSASISQDVNNMISYNNIIKNYAKALAIGINNKDENTVKYVFGEANITDAQKVKSEHFYVVLVPAQANSAAQFKYAVTPKEQQEATDIGNMLWSEVFNMQKFASSPVILIMGD